MNSHKLLWVSLAEFTPFSGTSMRILEKPCLLVVATASAGIFPPADENLLAYLTHSSNNGVGNIWLLINIHNQPFSIYCIHSCIRHSQFVLQDGALRDLGNTTQWSPVWKPTQTPTFPPIVGFRKHLKNPPPRAEIPICLTGLYRN